MTQVQIPAVFMRGGSSKGVFFKSEDLPPDRHGRAEIFLAALGSPDPAGRQLNGLGGGVSSLSKAVVLSKSESDCADIDYDFAQVAIGTPDVDWSTTCGNLSSAVGPFAVDAGMVAANGDTTHVRVRSVNTGKVFHAGVPTRGGRFDEQGDFAIPGVAGTGSKIRLDFLDPGGATTGRLLPTGRPVDTLDVDGDGTYEVTLIDATTAMVFVEARRFGLSGAESVGELESNGELMAKLDRLRRHAGVAMSLAPTPEDVALGNPRIGMIAPPSPYQILSGETVGSGDAHIAARILSMGQVHRVLPLTSAMCLGVACRLPGTLAAALAGSSEGDLLLANPSGILPVDARVTLTEGSAVAERVRVYRTARALMKGHVLVPDRAQAE